VTHAFRHQGGDQKWGRQEGTQGKNSLKVWMGGKTKQGGEGLGNIIRLPKLHYEGVTFIPHSSTRALITMVE